nr:hypothetical protein [Tanacetum cinerariifolium]
MEQPNPTFAKIPILDIGKFEQWKFKIQQYLQNEHYALWEVIEFGDLYEAPQEESETGSTSESSAKKKGRIVVVTTEDMQKRRNDQYGNFKAEGSETLEQTFNRLQAIVSHLEFMDVEIEQDDLNQNFLTTLAPEWLMYTIVWRNRSDLDTISLDDLYNHLKVYEPEVQKKSESNSQNMAFISSAKNSSGKGEVNTASIPTASTHVFLASADIKYEDINQIDKDDIEEMDIKWNMALLSIRTDRFWKKTGKKITIQGTDVAALISQRGRREIYKQGSKEEEQAPKDLMAIDGVIWNWSYMANEEENHALVADEEAPTEFALMAKSSSISKNEVFHKLRHKNIKIENLMNELKQLKKEKEGLDSKLTGFESASKDLDTLLGSQRSDKNKEGLRYNDTITDYSRPSPSVESNSSDLQNSSSSIFENGESLESIMSKPMIKFVKAAYSSTVIKTNKVETVRKPSVKYAVMYRNTTKSPRVRGNQRNWNNLKTQQLGKDFVMKNKACFKCGHFDHLAYDCGVWVNKGKTWPKNNYIHKRYWDNGCSRHMTGKISYLSDYEPYDGGYVSFGQGGGKITGKGIIKTGKLEFENVYFVKDLKYNLFSVSQICDNKNSVLFTNSECIVLGRDFKLKDYTNVLLRTPRQHNMYFIDLNNIVPHKDLTCLVAKASADESMLWHRRLGHLNFKTMNKLVRHNLVKGLPSRCFKNDHTWVACLKGKQHKASCKTKLVNSVSNPLHTLHMDLFGPTFDETSGTLRSFITEIKNLKELKVKINRCDNGGEFKNKEMNDFCSRKGIKREFSNARTPQQNRVAERRNKTLIEAARTMLADAKLPVTFWAEAVNTACYVQNRVLVNKS